MDFLSLHIFPALLGSTKPSRYIIYTSSSKFPFRKAVLTSICHISQSKYAAIARMIQKDLSITTGEKSRRSQFLELA